MYILYIMYIMYINTEMGNLNPAELLVSIYTKLKEFAFIWLHIITPNEFGLKVHFVLWLKQFLFSSNWTLEYSQEENVIWLW